MFDSHQLQTLFTQQLSNIYCAKSHLVERFSEILEDKHFEDIREHLTEAQEDVEQQLSRLDELFDLLNDGFTHSSYNEFPPIAEDIFTIIRSIANDKVSRDVSLWLYLNHIKTLEDVSLQTLNIMSRTIRNEELNKLIQKNIQSVKADIALNLIMAARCITYGIVV